MDCGATKGQVLKQDPFFMYDCLSDTHYAFVGTGLTEPFYPEGGLNGVYMWTGTGQ